jgi:hypothetical protein
MSARALTVTLRTFFINLTLPFSVLNITTTEGQSVFFSLPNEQFRAEFKEYPLWCPTRFTAPRPHITMMLPTSD